MAAKTLPSDAIMVMSAVMALSGAVGMVRSTHMAGPVLPGLGADRGRPIFDPICSPDRLRPASGLLRRLASVAGGYGDEGQQRQRSDGLPQVR